MQLSKLKTSDGTKTTVMVGILNLQVILAQEGDAWIAQAIEFDYASGGESAEDAKERFEKGLCETLQENFKKFGNVDKLLSTKPEPEFTLDLMKDPKLVNLFTSVTFHDFIPPNAKAEGVVFPYKEINYFGPSSAKSTASMARA